MLQLRSIAYRYGHARQVNSGQYAVYRNANTALSTGRIDHAKTRWPWPEDVLMTGLQIVHGQICEIDH